MLLQTTKWTVYLVRMLVILIERRYAELRRLVAIVLISNIYCCHYVESLNPRA